MEIESSFIETGVDKLVKIVNERGRIALSDAARELGVSASVVQEWVDFLEEEGIIGVEYKLTKPFLVGRKLTKKEVEDKVKEFASKKEIFVRKAEVSLSFLEKQAEDLRKVKNEFDKLKGGLGLELDKVRNEVTELEKYQNMRQELQKQIEEQKSDSRNKIEELVQAIAREQKKYQEFISDITREREQLAKEMTEAKSIEESEQILNKKLSELKIMVATIEKKSSEENTTIKNSELHIKKLNQLIDDARQRTEEEKSQVNYLVGKSKEQEKKMFELQDVILKKLSDKQKNVSNVNSIVKKVNEFFAKKLAVIDLVDRVNKDRNDLERSLMDLIKKAKSFQLTAKSGNFGRELIELEKKFNEVDRKKNIFMIELKKFSSIFKGD